MKSILLIFFAAVMSSVATAQDFLTPSKGIFERKWIHNSSYKMTWYVVKDTTKLAIGAVSTQISTDKKQLTVITQVNMRNMKSPWIDSTVADLSTLRPIRHSSYNMQRDMVLNFGKIVTGFYHDKTKKVNTSISDTTQTKYFDSNLYPILIGWLPLSTTYRKDISIYDYNPSAKIGVIKASVKQVTSGEYKSLKNGLRSVWIVTVTDEISDDPNSVNTYYFDKEDRRLWKQDIESKGRKMMMLLEE